MKYNKKFIDYLNQHSKLVTRRDFMAKGLLSATAMTTLPTMWNLLQAAEKKVLKSKSLNTRSVEDVPFLLFDLVGGAALPANFLVGKQGGPKDYLASYDRLGWDPKSQNALDERFGVPMAGGNISKILQGMLQIMSADAQSNLRFATLLHFARDDNADNPLSPLALVTRSLSKSGKVISNAMGLRNSASGGFSRLIVNESNFKPMFVQSLNDLFNALGVGNTFQGFSAESVDAFVKLTSQLSKTQIEEVLRAPANDSTVQFINEKYAGFASGLADSSNIDPRVDPNAQAVYNINQQNPVNSPSAVVASLVSGTLQGNLGPSVISISGCDYHTGNQTAGDAKDLEIGLQVGRAVELAKRYQKPLFFQLITDGGVSSDRGTRVWRTDDGVKCMSVMGYYHPTAAPKYRNQKMQVGAYTDGQGVNLNTLIGRSPALASYAAFANYLNISGKIGDFEKYAQNIFTSSELDSVLVFE